MSDVRTSGGFFKISSDIPTISVSQSVHVDVRICPKVANFFVFWTVIELTEAIVAEKEWIFRDLKSNHSNSLYLTINI